MHQRESFKIHEPNFSAFWSPIREMLFEVALFGGNCQVNKLFLCVKYRDFTLESLKSSPAESDVIITGRSDFQKQ